MSEYFSKTTCAGGCGNLMPTHLVKRGWQYLYGHKTGCPAEGEPVGKKAAKIKSAREVSPTRPGPVEHTNYERTLAMTVENLRACGVERDLAAESYVVVCEAALGRRSQAERQFEALERLARALLMMVNQNSPEHEQAKTFLDSISASYVQGGIVLAKNPGQLADQWLCTVCKKGLLISPLYTKNVRAGMIDGFMRDHRGCSEQAVSA